MSISFPSLRQFRQWRAEKKLGPAIVNHDLNAVRQCLENGARQIDFLLWREGDYPGEKVPVAKFTDPVRLAKYVGFKDDSLGLFVQYGLTPDDLRQKAPQGPRVG